MELAVVDTPLEMRREGTLEMVREGTLEMLREGIYLRQHDQPRPSPGFVAVLSS